MRLSRTEPIRFWVTLGILILLCLCHTPRLDATPTPETLELAAFEAASRFGDQSVVHFLESFYDSEKRPVVHVFLVTKNGSSLPEDLESSIEHGMTLRENGESLIETDHTDSGQVLVAMSDAVLHQADRYGTLLIALGDNEPSLVAFHHGLPTCLVARTDAEERAKAFSNGMDVTPVGVLYVSPLEYYYEFDIEGAHILVSPFHQRIVFTSDLDGTLETTFERPGEDLLAIPTRLPKSSFPIPTSLRASPTTTSGDRYPTVAAPQPEPVFWDIGMIRAMTTLSRVQERMTM